MADEVYIRQSMKRGDTWVFEVEIPGNDVSAWSWGCQWRTEPSSSSVFATASVDMTHAQTGLVILTVAASATANVTPPKTYYWDVQRSLAGAVETLVSGETEIEWDVTR